MSVIVIIDNACDVQAKYFPINKQRNLAIRDKPTNFICFRILC